MVIRDPWIRALVIVMLLIAAVYLTGLLWRAAVEFADLILLFFLAWVISFIVEPLVALLQQRARLPRNFSVLLVYLACMVLVSSTIVQLVPQLLSQVTLIANEIPSYAEWINGEALRYQQQLAQSGVTVSPESMLSYQEVIRHVEQLGPLLLSNTVGLATGVANLLFQVFIVLILSFYMALDGQRITNGLELALPRAYRHDARYFFQSVNSAFAGFIRGQVAQAAIYGFGTAAIMSVAGLKLVLLPSVLAGGFMLLPFVGPFLAMVAPLFVAAMTSPDVFWVLLIALFVLQQIVVNVVAPRLMSTAVGLHPLLVFVAVLGGARLAGVWGAVFGVPILAVVAAMVSFYRARVLEREQELKEAPAAEESAWPPAPTVSELGAVGQRSSESSPSLTAGAGIGAQGRDPTYR